MSIDPTNLSETALLTFSEEFETFDLWDGTSGLDTRPGFAMAKWADSGFVWTGTLNTLYVQPSDQDSTANGTFTVSNGILSIIANETAGSGLASGQSYTSGAITTYHEFSQLYGYFEIRAKVDNAAGTLPAFWLLPSEGIWPPELDVFEVLGSRPGELATTVHSQSAGIIEVGANHFQTANVASVGDLSTAFHSYGVDWQADTITWYLDGQMVFKAPTPADMHGPMYLIANLNVGGAWEGYPTVGNAFSSQLDIDYMRVYSERAQLSSPQDPSRMLTLRVSEDAYEGHAQFIVRVNGQQQGEARTATASHATGEYQDVHLLGDFTNARNVTIEFINDAYGGSATSDRNLYVDSITVNGKVFEAEQAVNGAGPLFGTEANMLSNGVLDFSLQTLLDDPSRMLTLRVSEDAYEGHAQFIVRVNGQQQGEARTATASHATGEYQDVHLLGDFTNARNVTIEFINDAYGGSATSDRNLYVDSITVNGKVFEAEQAVNGAGPLFGTEANMLSNGVLHFQDVM